MKTGVFSLMCLMLSISATAQDTTRVKKIDQLKQSKVTKQVVDAISRTPPADTVITIKSVDAFMPYEGKVIRHIHINRIGFDRTVQDTTRRFRSSIARIANRLHNDTKEWVVRENIFLREGKPFNPYRAADNERYLRDLDFILDSKIFVAPISEGSDSIDLLVMTRDVFSLGASFSPRDITEHRFRIQEANLGGMGQRLQVAGVYDAERNPTTGYEFLYRKTNLFGSFVNATAGYTEINTARSVGNENESAYFFRLDRPLFHPFVRWAGAAEISRNWSTNTTRKETDFVKYEYLIHDAWAGYSFGFKKLPGSLEENRNRRFIAVRAFEERFLKKPEDISEVDQLTYSNRATFLGQLTFFKQDFYKTNYVLGFGRTEDVPYGYRLSFTGGWENELNQKRIYTGAELNLSTVNENGTFYTYSVKLGNYWSKELIEDGLAQFGVSRYSRIYFMGKTKIRHQAEINFASQINREQKRLLDIRDANGIQGFRPDSLQGAQRLYFRTETVLFTPWKLAGFHFAPVARIDLTYLAKENAALFQKQNFYSGISAAMRARNENLIFNTIEARVFYYPKTVEDLEPWRFEFRANLRIKYPTNLITAPATVYDP